LCILKERDGVFFVGGVMPGSKAAALNAVHIGDVVASVDGRVLGSSSSVEDAVRMIDEPYGSDADVLLLRDVPRAGLLRVQLRFVRVWNDHAEDADDKEHDDASLEEGHATKFSPRSFGSTSSSFSTSRASPRRRYRSFYSLGSFDTQISSPQQSPREERRGAHVFNDVTEFGSDCDQNISQQPVHNARCGVGLMLKQIAMGNGQLLLVDGVVPGSAADACKRIMVGDALLHVNGCSVATFSSMDEVVDSMTGPNGTHVILVLHRALTDSVYTVTLVRKFHSAAVVGSRSSSRRSSRSSSTIRNSVTTQEFI
jgi:C-terminal processing protease CtpA/Prc